MKWKSHHPLDFGDSLSFGQLGFAPSKFPSQEFVLHNVHVSADDSL
jgi:hypothetical protein